MSTRKRDSGWSWAVLVATLMIQTIISGSRLAGGIFYLPFQEEFNASSVVTSWVTSLGATILMISGPLGSVLTNKIGYRLTAVVGSILSALGLSLGYFAFNIYWLLFTYGILRGIGDGLCYVVTFTAIYDYFDKYRTVGIGLTAVGMGMGPLVYGPLVQALIDEYSWRGAILILGAVTLNICVCACILRPFHSKKETQRESKKPVLNLTIFRKLHYDFYCVTCFLRNFGFWIFVIHIPPHAVFIGLTKETAAILISIYGGSNVVGKFFFTFIGHRPSADVIWTYVISMTLASVVIALFPVIFNGIAMMVMSGLVGFLTSATGVYQSVIIGILVGKERFADGLGMSMPFAAVGTVAGPVFAGYLYDTIGSFTMSFYIGGGIMLLSSLLMVYPAIIQRRIRRGNTCSTEEVDVVSNSLIPSQTNNVLSRDTNNVLSK